MLNNKLLMAAGAVTLSAGLLSGTSIAATITGANATANILKPIAIVLGVSGKEMNFGDIVPDSSAAADVVLDPAGSITSSTPATVSGFPSAGDFDVSGSNNASFTISLPANDTVALTDQGSTGGAPMKLRDFTVSTGAGTLDGSGEQTISIGATLEVGANQIESGYATTYDVTVNYQ